MSRITRQIFELAWPIFLGQIAVTGNAIIDTAMASRLSSNDLASLGLGSGAYVSLYVGLMGVIQAISPIIARAYGAKDLSTIRQSVHQSYWLALILSAFGMCFLIMPDIFFLISNPTPIVEEKARTYLTWMAISLPGALLFRVFYAINTAFARPKIVMSIQLIMLTLKIPLNSILMFGIGPWQGLGLTGCAIATAILSWLAFLSFLMFSKFDTIYQNSHLIRLTKPNFRILINILKLGLPIGAMYFIDVTSFTIMIFFINHFGTDTTSAQQIVGNMAVISYMIPLSLSNATSTLVAQAIGAHELPNTSMPPARAIATRGIIFAIIVACITGCILWFGRDWLVGLYKPDHNVTKIALSMITWMAIYHLTDALQVMQTFILRAYKITTLPMIIYAGTLWAIGLPMGYYFAFYTPLQSNGFWVATLCSSLLANIALSLLLRQTLNTHPQTT